MTGQDDAELIELLSDDKMLSRRKALRAIIAKPAPQSEEVISAVLRLRGDKDRRTRCLVSEVLLRNNRERLLDAWVELLRDRSSEVVNNAQAGLVELSGLAVPRLVDEIVNKSSEGRFWGSDLLGRIGLSAVPALLELEKSADKEIAFRGRHGLAQVDVSITPLEELQTALLTHSDPATQKYLMTQLVHRADEVPLDVWLDRVGHPNIRMRQMTALALPTFGRQEGVGDALLELLRDETVVATAALESLDGLDFSEAADDLVKLFHRERAMRGRVIEVLSRLSRPSVVDCGADAAKYVIDLVERPESRMGWNNLSAALEMLKALMQQDLVRIDDRLVDLLIRNVEEYSAGKSLVIIGEKVVPRLLEEFDANPESRSTIASVLGKIGDNRACLPLRNAVPDCSEEELHYFLPALGQLGDRDALPLILSQRSHPNWQVRETVIESLGELRAPDGLEAVAAGLEDEKREVRRAAVFALGQIQGDEALRLLIELLEKTQDDYFREAAIIAVGDFGSSGTAAVSTLVGLLDDRTHSAWDYIADAWNKRGDDDHYWIRLFAARSLGKIGDPAAAGPLVDAAEKNKSDWWVREEIAIALGHINNPVAREGLRMLQKDPEEEVRIAASEGLARQAEP